MNFGCEWNRITDVLRTTDNGSLRRSIIKFFVHFFFVFGFVTWYTWFAITHDRKPHNTHTHTQYVDTRPYHCYYPFQSPKIIYCCRLKFHLSLSNSEWSAWVCVKYVLNTGLSHAHIFFPDIKLWLIIEMGEGGRFFFIFIWFVHFLFLSLFVERRMAYSLITIFVSELSSREILFVESEAL